MTGKRMILIEFNELCPELLDRFMAAGELPNFKRFFDSSESYLTEAGEEYPRLEPWIQWVTVHSGMPFSAHGVFKLGEGHSLGRSCLGELLSGAGLKVGICASMNQNYRSVDGYLIPDFWDKEGRAQPQELQLCYEFMAKQVQESSRHGAKVGQGESMRFARFMLGHGLSLRTIAKILSQLATEAMDGGLRWRRPVLLDWLLYDLFHYLDRKYQPHFSTFFSNSTAHFQHYYWRNMEPSAFGVEPDATDHKSLQEAILYGYKLMDGLIARFLHDFSENTLLILCTALSQQPWPNTTKCGYRPRDFRQFLSFARVEGYLRIRPVMAEEFYLDFDSPEAATLAECRLADLKVEGHPLMRTVHLGKSLFIGCALIASEAITRQIWRSSDGVTQRVSDLFYIVHGRRSGRHHPFGSLWIRTGAHRRHPGSVPLTTIAPTVLRYFGVPLPDHMKSPPLNI